ncbi:peptidoglycan-binding protein [Alphaproteobacteria bacterium GH1-50]|uniref:Peptidoglycan-binding protein n=1 Tax=Kangsaoukella pontilimi TaxID=2691042 RepID=A0A7C9MBV6_9RHOB|nr:serine protease [Kangsaoukella pontilimi]MXQ06692.1 peptidoglycan-binding protein [Kangsaoukella pontilimi]
MRRFFGAVALFAAIAAGHPALAQDTTAWIQIEARPTEGQALERAEIYAARLPDVNGFALSSGWFAITLGPYPEGEARARLAALRGSAAIPGDSFLADGRGYGARFFGGGAAALQPAPSAEPLPEPEPGEQTVTEARNAERALTRDDREEVQIALRAAGFYNSIIDADFGSGTRRAMADWQAANGFEATGVLTTLQRRDLVGTYRDALAALDLSPVEDLRAGIAATLPLGRVTFERYEPPFAHFTGEDGARVLLISQSGDAATLAGLYEVLQTLEIMPLDGPRNLRRGEFTIDGQNYSIRSHAYARQADGAVKGYVVVWPTDEAYAAQLAITALEQSFRTLDGVLPDEVNGPQSVDLLSGLAIRQPAATASGFYVSRGGDVLTSAHAVAGCARVEIENDLSATVVATDEALGLALLRPEGPIAPMAYARLASAEPRLSSDIAVAGYSFGGVLTAPSVTFGTLEDVRGLDGDESLHRLAVAARDGDAGGPVLDDAGRVAGLLLPPAEDARQLPEGVVFARDTGGIAGFLEAQGIVSPSEDSAADSMAPEDLTQRARDMTVLVTCWN